MRFKPALVRPLPVRQAGALRPGPGIYDCGFFNPPLSFPPACTYSGRQSVKRESKIPMKMGMTQKRIKMWSATSLPDKWQAGVTMCIKQ